MMMVMTMVMMVTLHEECLSKVMPRLDCHSATDTLASYKYSDGHHYCDENHDDHDGDHLNLFAAGVLAADLGSIVVPLEDRIRSVFRIVSRKTCRFACQKTQTTFFR